jgi:hypothetical protein
MVISGRVMIVSNAFAHHATVMIALWIGRLWELHLPGEWSVMRAGNAPYILKLQKKRRNRFKKLSFLRLFLGQTILKRYGENHRVFSPPHHEILTLL